MPLRLRTVHGVSSVSGKTSNFFLKTTNQIYKPAVSWPITYIIKSKTTRKQTNKQTNRKGLWLDNRFGAFMLPCATTDCLFENGLFLFHLKLQIRKRRKMCLDEFLFQFLRIIFPTKTGRKSFSTGSMS